jgi:ribosome recycling factor
MLGSVFCSYYGSATVISSSKISVPDIEQLHYSRLKKTCCKQLRKAIMVANIGFSQ